MTTVQLGNAEGRSCFLWEAVTNKQSSKDALGQAIQIRLPSTLAPDSNQHQRLSLSAVQQHWISTGCSGAAVVQLGEEFFSVLQEKGSVWELLEGRKGEVSDI